MGINDRGIKTMKSPYSFASLLLRCLTLLLCILLDTLAQYSAPVTDTLKWKNIASRYKNFVEVRPILVNDGKESIFLSRIWPHGYAQLQRWNETTGKWETGDWGIGCDTVSNPTIPIEIKPGTEQEIHVYWQLSMDDWEHPKHFVVEDTDEKRPFKGKYRFFLRYAKLPWTVAHRPGKINTLESPEFQVSS